MATEKRLIDLDAVIRKLEDEILNRCPSPDPEDPPFMVFQKRAIKKLLRNVIDYLKNQPTVDAVEVVRCKDCKWYEPRADFCTFWDSVRHPEHYCGEGDPKNATD